jgi:hypothetical protein
VESIAVETSRKALDEPTIEVNGMIDYYTRLDVGGMAWSAFDLLRGPTGQISAVMLEKLW